MTKTLKVDPKFFKDLEFKVGLPTFECRVCDEQILDCPSNWHLKKVDYQEGKK